MPRPTPGAIARRLVSDNLSQQLYLGSALVGAIVDRPEFDVLVAALVEDLPAHVRKDVMSQAEEADVEARVHEALPEPLRAAAARLSESESARNATNRDAMFLIGLELGRQLAGGVR